MAHQLKNIVALARAGRVEAAQKLMAETDRKQGLSGHDLQTCDNVIIIALDEAGRTEDARNLMTKPNQGHALFIRGQQTYKEAIVAVRGRILEESKRSSAGLA